MIDTALRSFSHSISFRRTDDIGDISAAPKRKVLFPSSAPVSRFIEKTAIRYRLKGTNYTFEIARYDEYSRTAIAAFPEQTIPTMAGPISETPSTSWGASVFDPNWDNLLGQHANLPVGHSARYSPNLDTFFQPTEQSAQASGENNAGFWDFIHLVKQATELLSPKQTCQLQEPQKHTRKESLSPVTMSNTLDGQKRTTSPDSSSSIYTNGLSGMIDADLGTLF